MENLVIDLGGSHEASCETHGGRWSQDSVQTFRNASNARRKPLTGSCSFSWAWNGGDCEKQS